MNPILKNVLAVLAGIIVGSIVNMGLITVGPMIIPVPEGIDPTNMDSLKENMHLLSAQNFIFPFLAHALGTLVGALVAAKLAATRPMAVAIGIGIWFLIGGIANIVMLPGSPMWYNILDLAGAYIPMAWLGGKIGLGRNY